MQKAELKVVSREGGSKAENKKLRTGGFVPASVYGHGTKSLSCAFSEREMRKVFNNDFETNCILTLASDSTSLNGKKVVLKDMERHPVSWAMTHVDFYEIAMDKPLSVSVPLHYQGTAEGVKSDGGILQVVRRSVRIKALPADIPSSIDVDISALGLGDSLHIGEVNFSDKIKVLDSSEFVLVSIVEAEKEEVAVPVATAEGAAAAAGTGATAAAGTGTAAAAATGATAAPAGDAAKAPAKK